MRTSATHQALFLFVCFSFCHFTGNISFIPHYEITLLLFCCPEKLSHLPRVTQQVGGKVGIQTQESVCKGSMAQDLTTQCTTTS